MITMNTKPPLQPSSSFYPPTLLNSFPRIPHPASSIPNDSMFSSASAFMPAQAYVQADHNSAFYPTGNVMMSNHSTNQQQVLPWRNFPGWTFDQLGVYPYGTGYSSLDVRRKNATRESTSTLKAWLYEHIKNPYPTKAEKIMLAIITKMTLTQVSTWFANARRRLKKENKMQWSPRNRTGEEEDDDDDKNSDNDDMAESDTSRHRAMDDDLLDDGDIIVDGGVDEIPEAISMPVNCNVPKPTIEEISKDGHLTRDETLRTSISNHHQQLHPKFHQQSSHPHLYFNPQNPNRHLSFPPFHPSLRNFSSLQQSFNFINKAFMPRFKSLTREEDKETNGIPTSTFVNVSQSSVSSSREETDMRASTPGKIHSNEVDKKPTKPRIWCLADVATSGNKDKENNNNHNTSVDGDGAETLATNDYKKHSISAMRQVSIHQALVQFYHPYFSHLTSARTGDKSFSRWSETFDRLSGAVNGETPFPKSPTKSGDEKSGSTFQPWLNLNQKLNQGIGNQDIVNNERINREEPNLYRSSNHSPGSTATTPHSSPEVKNIHNSRFVGDATSLNDALLDASKSSPSLSSSSSPSSNLSMTRRRREIVENISPCLSESSSPSPPSSSSSLPLSSSSLSLLSSTAAAASKSLSSSLLFQAPAHLPLSSDVIISAPQSPLVYRKHSPSRDSTFEYWPSGRLIDK